MSKRQLPVWVKIFSHFPCGNSGKAHSTQGQQNTFEVHSSLGKSAEELAAAGTYANHLGIGCSFCHEVSLVCHYEKCIRFKHSPLPCPPRRPLQGLRGDDVKGKEIGPLGRCTSFLFSRMSHILTATKNTMLFIMLSDMKSIVDYLFIYSFGAIHLFWVFAFW